MTDTSQKRRSKRLRRIGLPLFVVLLAFGGFQTVRLFGWCGYPKEIALKKVVGGEERYCHNTQFSRRLSAGDGVFRFTPFAFTVEKGARTYRVFILGGSAAQGFPDEYYDFGRMLEIMLKDQYSGTDFEVINVAMRGIDSAALYKVAKSCAGFEPDLMIVHDLDVHECPEDEMRRICREGIKSGAKVLLVARGVPGIPQIEGVPSLDLGQVLEAAESYGVSDKELLFDVVHYRFGGNYVVARALLDAVRPLLPDGMTQRGTGKDNMGLSECEERLVYTDLERFLSTRHMLTLLKRESTRNREIIRKLESEADALKPSADAVLKQLLPRYRELTTRHPDDWRLNWKASDYAYRFYRNSPLAIDQAEKVLKSVQHPHALVIVMRLAIGQGRLNDAEKCAATLINMRPHLADHYFDMGEILKIRGEYEEAIKYYAKGIKLQPGMESVVAYAHLAELYEAEGRPEKAIKTLYRAIKDEPIEHAGATYVNLALLLAEKGRDDESLDVLRKAISRIPVAEIPRRDEVRALLVKLGEIELAAKLASTPEK